MYYIVFPNIEPLNVGRFSRGGQPLALLMIRNLLAEHTNMPLSFVDECVEPLDLEQIHSGDTVLLSLTFLNLKRSKDIVQHSLSVGAAVMVGGSAIEIVGGDARLLDLPVHPSITCVSGGWADVFEHILGWLGVCNGPITWDGLAAYQYNRISHTHVDWHTAWLRDQSNLVFDGQAVNVHFHIGCSYRVLNGGCHFCSRSPEPYAVMRPHTYVHLLQYLAENWNAGLIRDTSDTFFASPDDLEALIEAGIEELDCKFMIFARAQGISQDVAALLARCGVKYAIIGVESGSDRILQIANKGITSREAISAIELLSEAGISCIPCFTVGHPSETETEVRKTAKQAEWLVRHCDVSAISCSPIVPLPGSRYFDMLPATARAIPTFKLTELQAAYFGSLPQVSLAFSQRISEELEAMSGSPVGIWGGPVR